MAAPAARPATRARPRPTRCAPAPPRAAPGAWLPARPGALPRPPRLSARTERFELGGGSDICPASGRRLPRPAMLMKHSTHGVSRHWRSPWLTPGGRQRPRGLVLKAAPTPTHHGLRAARPARRTRVVPRQEAQTRAPAGRAGRLVLHMAPRRAAGAAVPAARAAPAAARVLARGRGALHLRRARRQRELLQQRRRALAHLRGRAPDE